jgi:hypothetical protein
MTKMIVQNNLMGSVLPEAGADSDIRTSGSMPVAQALSQARKGDVKEASYNESARPNAGAGSEWLAGRILGALIDVSCDNKGKHGSGLKVTSNALGRKGQALLRKAAHRVSDGVKSLRKPFIAMSDASRIGGFTLPQPYAEHTALTAPDFERLGLRSEEAAVFENLATEEQLHIFVRTGTSARTINVGRPGLRPKPAGMYQKTSKGAEQPGLVLYGAGEQEKGNKDLTAINNPGRHVPASLQVLAEEGLHTREIGQDLLGVRDEADNFFYGDIDIHSVSSVQADGTAKTVPASEFVPLFNERLIATGLHGPHLLESATVMREKEYGVLPYSPIQHGAHDEWTERNNGNYAGGVNMGPLPGVIHFSPDDAPYHIETVAEYRDVSASLDLDPYVGEAWAMGRNRSGMERYRKVV